MEVSIDSKRTTKINKLNSDDTNRTNYFFFFLFLLWMLVTMQEAIGLHIDVSIIDNPSSLERVQETPHRFYSFREEGGEMDPTEQELQSTDLIKISSDIV